VTPNPIQNAQNGRWAEVNRQQGTIRVYITRTKDSRLPLTSPCFVRAEVIAVLYCYVTSIKHYNSIDFYASHIRLTE
jgi:hypothetical protein